MCFGKAMMRSDNAAIGWFYNVRKPLLAIKLTLLWPLDGYNDGPGVPVPSCYVLRETITAMFQAFKPML